MFTRIVSPTRLFLATFLFGTVVGLGIVAPRAALADTLVVDDDGQASLANCAAANATFSAIQSAVNAAATGDTVKVCPGVYDEQVSVTASHLTIRGAGASQTVLRPAVIANNAINIFGNDLKAVLLVQNASNVIIANLSIDGSLGDSGAQIAPPCPILPFFTGLYLSNSSVTVDTVHVSGIQSGTACAFAIRAEIGDVSVKASLIDNYGTTGIACAFDGTRCSLTGNTIRGRGPVDDELQVGIQLRSGAAGKIAGNVITDHAFIGAHGVPQSAVGIFLVYAAPTSNPFIVRDNIFSGNQVNVQRIATAAAF